MPLAAPIAILSLVSQSRGVRPSPLLPEILEMHQDTMFTSLQTAMK